MWRPSPPVRPCARRTSASAGRPRQPTPAAVFALAANGDAAAIRAVGVAAAAAGQAVGGLANILDPEVVVVSGGLADAGPSWWGPMERALRAELLPALADLPVLPAALGNAAALVGAASLVLTAAPILQRN